MALQGCDFAREFFDAVKRHHADFGIFQCHGVTSVVVIDDAIRPITSCGHLKARNLVAPVFCGHAGFEKTGANGIKRRERLAIAKQRAPTLDLAPCGHDVINAFELVVVRPSGMQSSRRLQLEQATLMVCGVMWADTCPVSG